MERQTLAGHGVDVIDGPIMLIIELCIRSSARDTFLTFPRKVVAEKSACGLGGRPFRACRYLAGRHF
jgi:hypothetical protein